MSDAVTANSSCPRCGASFRCGMIGGDGACWCASQPPLTALPVPSAGSAASCFCPVCLEAVRAERLGVEGRR